MNLHRLTGACLLLWLSRLGECSINLSCFGFLWAKLPTLSISSSGGIAVSEQGYLLSNVPANGTFNVDLCVVGVLGFLAVQVVPLIVGSVQRELREDEGPDATAQLVGTTNQKIYLQPGQKYQQPFISSLPIGDSPVNSYVWPASYETEDYGASSSSNNILGYRPNSSNSGYDSSDKEYPSSGSGAPSHAADGASAGSLAPAYRLPGSPDLYSLSGDSDTYILHGQVAVSQHGQEGSLDKWPAVDQPDNHLTQEVAPSSSSTRPSPVYRGSNKTTLESQDWSNSYIQQQQHQQQKQKQQEQLQQQGEQQSKQQTIKGEEEAGQPVVPFAGQDYQDIDYTSGNEVSYHISLSK